jgi:hypothetical protein
MIWWRREQANSFLFYWLSLFITSTPKTPSLAGFRIVFACYLMLLSVEQMGAP